MFFVCFFLYKSKVGRRKPPKGTDCSGWPLWKTTICPHTKFNSVIPEHTRHVHVSGPFHQHRSPLPSSRLCSNATYSMIPPTTPFIAALLNSWHCSISSFPHCCFLTHYFIYYLYVYCPIPPAPDTHTECKLHEGREFYLVTDISPVPLPHLPAQALLPGPASRLSGGTFPAWGRQVLVDPNPPLSTHTQGCQCPTTPVPTCPRHVTLSRFPQRSLTWAVWPPPLLHWIS